MIIYAEYSLSDILSLTEYDHINEKKNKEFIVNDKIYKANINSQRLKVFRNSIVCSSCGIEGKVFRLENHSSNKNGSPHFNLYSIVNEKYILMTKDHIISKYKGGEDIMSNYQTMCAPCNEKKGGE